MFRRLLEPPQPITLLVDGREVTAAAGDTVAAALLLAGELRFRRMAGSQAPRGLYCGIGVCFDCLVTIDGAPNRQACLVPVADGMVVTTGFHAPADPADKPA